MHVIEIYVDVAEAYCASALLAAFGLCSQRKLTQANPKIKIRMSNNVVITLD